MHQRVYSFLLSFLLIFYVNVTNAQNPFVSIKLSNGIYFELPRNWKVFDLNTKTTLESSVAARFPIKINSNLPFAANLYNTRNQTIGIMNIRLYPDIKFKQQDVSRLTFQDILDFNNLLKKNITKGVNLAGGTVTNWYGTEKIKIRNKVYLLSKYRRSSAINKNSFFKVSLLRLLDGRNSFTLTLSYEEKEEYLLKPIIVYIMKSVRL